MLWTFLCNYYCQIKAVIIKALFQNYLVNGIHFFIRLLYLTLITTLKCRDCHPPFLSLIPLRLRGVEYIAQNNKGIQTQGCLIASKVRALWDGVSGPLSRGPRTRAFPGTLHVCIWPLGAQASQLSQTPFRRFRILPTPALGSLGKPGWL